MEILEEILHSSDHFTALGLAVAITPPAAIRTAFRRRSLHAHPDKCNDPRAAHAFRILAAAFDTLHDEKSQRRAYSQLAGEPRGKRARNSGPGTSDSDGIPQQRSWADWEKDLGDSHRCFLNARSYLVLQGLIPYSFPIFLFLKNAF